MSNEIVKYNNELNFVPFNNFNKREFNILFVIISKLKDKGTKKTELSFNEIKKLSNYKQRGNKFLKDLENVYNKILSLKIWRESSNVYESWVLFTYYKIDNNNQSISIKVNPDLSNILNNLSRWTRFNLENFVLLNSTYSKTIFRLLKQYRVVGKRTFDLNNFKMLLGIPKSYRASDINKRVLQPIMIELSAYFKGLNIKKNKMGRSGKILSYSFYWKPEDKNSDDFSKGYEKDKKDKINNINFNNYLSKDEKEKAISKIENSLKKFDTKDIPRRYITDDKEFNEIFDKYLNF